MGGGGCAGSATDRPCRSPPERATWGPTDRGSDRYGLVDHTVTESRLEHRGGNDLDLHAEELAQLALEGGEANERHPVVDVHEQVDVARWTIVASGDAA